MKKAAILVGFTVVAGLLLGRVLLRGGSGSLTFSLSWRLPARATLRPTATLVSPPVLQIQEQPASQSAVSGQFATRTTNDWAANDWEDGQRASLGQTLPLEQTLDGYTLRITKMSWVAPSLSHDPCEKVLRIDYDLKATGSAKELSKGQVFNSDFNGIRGMRMIGPHGEEALGGSGGSYATYAIDPRWNKATAEFEFQDPAVPSEVAGPFQDTLEFNDIPVPHKIDEPLEINRSITTDRRDRFKLLQTRVRAVDQGDGGMVGELAFSLRQENKAGAILPWGLSQNMQAKVIKIVDDKGKDITATVSNNGAPVYDGEHPDRSVFAVRPLSGHPKEVSVQIRIEQSPLRLPRKWYHSFRFNIDPSEVPMPTQATPAQNAPAQGAAATTVAATTVAAATGNAFRNNAVESRTAKGKMADVTIEKLLMWDGKPLTTYQTRMWIRDKRRDTLLHFQREWVLWDVKRRWKRGTSELVSDTYVPDPACRGEDWQLFWKTDGTPLGTDESGLLLGGFSTEEHMPKSIDYELTLEAMHKYSYGLRFKDIPMPKPGEVLEPNIPGIAPTSMPLSGGGFTDATSTGGVAAGARLVLRRISYFPNEELWKALPAEKRGMGGVGIGLRALFVLERNSEGATKGSTINLRCNEVTDNKKREVFQQPWLRTFSQQMLRREQLKDGNQATFTLAPPEPDAKSFDMLVRVNEFLPTGEQETFVVQDVPVPQK